MKRLFILSYPLDSDYWKSHQFHHFEFLEGRSQGLGCVSGIKKRDDVLSRPAFMNFIFVVIGYPANALTAATLVGFISSLG